MIENKKILIVLFILFFASLNTLLFVINLKFDENISELENISKNIMSKIDEGNCETYTRFYKQEFEKLNINTYKVTIPTTNEVVDDYIVLGAHTFLIVYDEYGYCKLDQENINCIEYLL